MAATLTITGVTPGGSVQGVGAGFISGMADKTKNAVIVVGVITLTGSYGTHGDPLIITSSTIGSAIGAFGNYAPILGSVKIDDLAVYGTAPPAFVYKYAYGPTLAAPTQNGGAIQIFGSGASSGAGFTEISGAYSSASPSLNGAVLSFWAMFQPLMG